MGRGVGQAQTKRPSYIWIPDRQQIFLPGVRSPCGIWDTPALKCIWRMSLKVKVSWDIDLLHLVAPREWDSASVLENSPFSGPGEPAWTGLTWRVVAAENTPLCALLRQACRSPPYPVLEARVGAVVMSGGAVF